MKTILTAAAAVLALTGAAPAAEVTLRVHHFLSAESPVHVGLLTPWEKAVEEQSGGRIDVQLYPSMQLGGKPPQLFDQARDGIVDVSWTLLGYTPGRFPIAEVFELPFMAGTAAQTTTALQAFQAKYLGEELGQVHTLLLHAPAAYKFHMVKGPVASLDDLKGKKVRAPSRAMTDALNALGATAVGMPVPEVAQSLTTGVIDGAQIPWEVVGSLRVDEIAKFHSEIGSENGGMSTAVMALVMNKAKYEGLPDDLKAVIDANAGANLAKVAGPLWDEVEAKGREKAVAAGNAVNVIPADQLQPWRDAVQPVVDAWVAAQGEAGQAMLDDARAMLAAAGAK